MKKHSILTCLAALLLALVGCVREFPEPVVPDAPHGKFSFKIGVDISAAEPLATRAILDGVPEQPDGTYFLKDDLKFYIFVFEDNGSLQANYLRELVYGNDIFDMRLAGSHDHAYADPVADKPLLEFRAHFSGTAEKAILHIVATADPDFEKQLKSVPDRSEFGIFTGANGLYTAAGEAYWKRIELGRPINKENQTAIQNALGHVNMVRNFCRVTLKDAPAKAGSLHGFHSEAFIVVNAIDRGYVAAYNESLGDGGAPGFVEFEDPQTGQHRTYRDLNDVEKYVPSRHPASGRVNPDDDPDAGGWAAAFEAGTGGESNLKPKFMFERSVQDVNRTFVILKGYYDGKENEKRYFKLDLGTIDASVLGEDGSPFGIFENFHLIRNISYDISITNVAENVGHTTVKSALESYPSNNIATSIETRPLTTIYDGIDKMEVNFVSLVIVDDDEGNPYPDSKDMMWRYFQDYTDLNTSAPYTVKWNYPGYDFAFDGGKDPDGVIARWDGGSQTASTATPGNDYNYDTKTWTVNDSKDFGDDWRGFRLYFNAPDDVLRQKTIRLYSPFGLTRDVTFILHKRWEFVDSRPELYSNIEVYPGHYSYEDGTMPFESLDEMREALNYGDYQDGEGYVGSQFGAQLTVLFELPVDLPEAIFPLDFKIGFDRQNTENAYAGNAVVTWGDSLFEEDDIAVPRMQFVKTIEWRDYNAHRIVCARFLTTTDVLYELDTSSPDVATTRVRVTNPYFMPGNDSFERSSHQDVIDPTRTRWHWNFTYPEWINYFELYYGRSEDPHSFNNLNFKDYDQSSSSHGNYIYTGSSIGVAEDGTSHETSAFYFPVDFSTADYTGTLTIRAQVHQGRSARQQEQTGTIWPGIPTYRYWFDLYDRDIYAAVVTESDEVIRIPYSATQDFADCNQQSPGVLNPNGAGSPKNPEDFVFKMENISADKLPAGTKIKEIRIWSQNDSNWNVNQDPPYEVKNGSTNYYDILFTLTPKPQN